MLYDSKETQGVKQSQDAQGTLEGPNEIRMKLKFGKNGALKTCLT